MASALANPSRLIAQSSHFLSTAAKRSTRASIQLGRSLTQSLTVGLTGLLDHQHPTAADAPLSRKRPLPGRRASASKTGLQGEGVTSGRRASASKAGLPPPSRSDGRGGGSAHTASTALWALPTAAAGAPPGATSGATPG